MKVYTAGTGGAGTEQQLIDGVNGYLFFPAKHSKAGAVILLHERYGIVEHSQRLGKKLADAGYVALLPDLFADADVDKEQLHLGKARARVPDGECEEIIGKCIDYLKTDERVDGSKIAVMGICLTGRYSILVSGNRDDVACNIVYYGASSDNNWLVNEYQPEPMEEMIGRLRVPTLLAYGENDHTISIDHVLRMKGALEQARKSYRMKVFAGAPHGFLNDTMPGRYRHEQAEQAWQMLIDFLEEIFGGKWSPDRVRWEFASDIGTDYDFSKNKRVE